MHKTSFTENERIKNLIYDVLSSNIYGMYEENKRTIF